jgi:hypothetical protein
MQHITDIQHHQHNQSPFLTEQLYTTNIPTTSQPVVHIQHTNTTNNNNEHLYTTKEQDLKLLHKLQHVPYDGMAAIVKTTSIADILNNTVHTKVNNDTSVFPYKHAQFPLLKTLSNRKMLNNQHCLINSLLVGTRLPLLASEENVIKYKSYSTNNRKEKKNKWKGNRNGKGDIKMNTDFLVTTGFGSVYKGEGGMQTEPSGVFDLMKKEKEFYKMVKLRNYNANVENRNYLNQLKPYGKDDYVRNGYKIYKPDEMLDKIKKDVTKLKFGYNLKKI